MSLPRVVLWTVYWLGAAAVALAMICYVLRRLISFWYVKRRQYLDELATESYRQDSECGHDQHHLFN